jgi:hypothetical protein
LKPPRAASFATGATTAHATDRIASARAKINIIMVKAVSMALASERVAREEEDRSLLVDLDRPVPPSLQSH